MLVKQIHQNVKNFEEFEEKFSDKEKRILQNGKKYVIGFGMLRPCTPKDCQFRL